MRFIQQAVSLGLALGVLLAAGCGGLSGNEPVSAGAAAKAPIQLGTGQPLAQPGQAVPSLPALAELDRLSSVSRQASELFSYDPISLPGDAFVLGDDSAVISSDWDAAELPAGSRDSSWVIYRFFGLEDDALLGYLEAAVGDATQQRLYYALADYAAGSWQWFSLDVPDLVGLQGIFSHSLEEGGDYISDTGSLYFAVATWDTASCKVLRSSLYVGVREEYVQGLNATDGAFADEIEIGWEALEDSAGYELYFRLTEFPGPLMLLDAVDGGDEVQFVHSTTAPPEYPAVKGTQYIYFIMAVFPDGYRSQLSGWDTGYCGELQ